MAEEYFKKEYTKIQEFKMFNLTDTTNLACGFDYKLSCNSDFYCVEVKGLNEMKGSIQFTEKEYYVAQNRKSRYCLFIVKIFKEKPIHDIVFDPLNPRCFLKKLKFK